MKVGDLVRKTHGAAAKGAIGIILEISTNAVGNTVITVETQGSIQRWYSEYVEVVNFEGTEQ